MLNVSKIEYIYICICGRCLQIFHRWRKYNNTMIYYNSGGRSPERPVAKEHSLPIKGTEHRNPVFGFLCFFSCILFQ